MGGLFQSIGSLFTGSRPTSGGGQYVSQPNISSLAGLGNQLYQQGNPIYNQAMGTYNLGMPTYNQGQNLFLGADLSGALTPEQQALLTQNLGQENVGTQGTYANLDLAGSTMQNQDMAGNLLKNTAETANIEQLNREFGLQQGYLGLAGEQAGLQPMQIANQGLNTALGYYGGAGTDFANAASLQNQSTQQLMNAVSSLGNKSTSGLLPTAARELGIGTAGTAGGAGAGPLGLGAAPDYGAAITSGSGLVVDPATGALPAGLGLGASDLVPTAATTAAVDTGAFDVASSAGAAGGGLDLLGLLGLA